MLLTTPQEPAHSLISTHVRLFASALKPLPLEVVACCKGIEITNDQVHNANRSF